MGSGTSLVEASIKGLKAIGTDLNPLARLISNAKTTQYPLEKLKDNILTFKNDFIDNKQYLKYKSDIAEFDIIDTWFKEKTKIELGYIRGFINTLKNEKVKLFFLVALLRLLEMFL